MGFFNETTSLFEENGLILDFKIECLGREAVVVNGYKTIVKLTEGEVVLKLKKEDTITIKGARLYIKRMEEDEVVIAGKILEILL